jgi:hypothetical protein
MNPQVPSTKSDSLSTKDISPLVMNRSTTNQSLTNQSRVSPGNMLSHRTNNESRMPPPVSTLSLVKGSIHHSLTKARHAHNKRDLSLNEEYVNPTLVQKAVYCPAENKRIWAAAKYRSWTCPRGYAFSVDDVVVSSLPCIRSYIRASRSSEDPRMPAG